MSEVSLPSGFQASTGVTYDPDTKAYNYKGKSYTQAVATDNNVLLGNGKDTIIFQKTDDDKWALSNIAPPSDNPGPPPPGNNYTPNAIQSSWLGGTMTSLISMQYAIKNLAQAMKWGSNDPNQPAVSKMMMILSSIADDIKDLADQAAEKARAAGITQGATQMAGGAASIAGAAGTGISGYLAGPTGTANPMYTAFGSGASAVIQGGGTIGSARSTEESKKLENVTQRMQGSLQMLQQLQQNIKEESQLSKEDMNSLQQIIQSFQQASTQYISLRSNA